MRSLLSLLRAQASNLLLPLLLLTARLLRSLDNVRMMTMTMRVVRSFVVVFPVGRGVSHVLLSRVLGDEHHHKRGPGE